MSDTNDQILPTAEELLARRENLNRQLGLTIPNNIQTREEQLQWLDLFEIIRLDFEQSTLTVDKVPSILDLFYSLSYTDKEIYLQEYANKVESQPVEQKQDLTLEEYNSELEKIAQEVPESLRDLFYYVHYSQETGTPMDPEIEKIWKNIQENGVGDYLQQQKLAEAMDKRKTLDTRNLSTKPGFNKPLTSHSIEDLLNTHKTKE